jgi:signal transduction histidine kinase
MCKGKILIIDDEPTICQSCAQVLCGDGYTVDSGRTGAEGLDKYNTSLFDVVFLDLKMPGLSGMEVLERLRSADENVVTVVITGYATVESAVESIKRGAFDFLPKPFTPDELRIIAGRASKHRKLILEAANLRREKEKMRERFISMVSHQLKVPLVAVQQYFEVILGGMTGEINEKQKHMLMRSQCRIGELLKLIDKWLSFSRIDREMLVREYIDFDIVEVITNICTFLEPLADEKSIKISIEGDDTCRVRAHQEFIHEALTNLISNSINYNKKGGSVIVCVSRLPQAVRVEIKDTGIGIEKDALPHIFDEFYRSQRAKVTLGSGLGLSIVKRIIEAHTGTITVASVIDVGSTFVVELPAQAARDKVMPKGD